MCLRALPCLCGSDCRLPVRRESCRQPSSEGDPVCGDCTAVGHSSDCAPPQPPATARVPQGQSSETRVCMSTCATSLLSPVLVGHGAAGLDPHAAQRAATAVPSRRDAARQSDGRQPGLGRRQDHHSHMQVLQVIISQLTRTSTCMCKSPSSPPPSLGPQLHPWLLLADGLQADSARL